jgi:hypothetical protein
VSSGHDPGAQTLITAARTLAIDALASELSKALCGQGVEPILLKGGTLSDWLYDSGAVRTYGDVDLLVEPADIPTAERLLAGWGFLTGPGQAPAETPHARPWRRPADGAVVDLHWTISGSCVSPEKSFSILFENAEKISLGGGEVRALNRIACALLVVLHASQHGEGKPVMELRRALARLSEGEWREVRALADRLQAEYGLSDGLRLLPEGRRVAALLELPPPALFEASMDDRSALVLGIERLRRASGLRARTRLVIGELLPAADFMRWTFPLARRGRLGLAAAYVWRLSWLGRRLFPSLLAWRRTQRG